MTTPTSYQAPKRSQGKERTHSQTLSTNTAAETGTVAQLLKGKDGAVIAIGPDDTLSNAVAILKEKRIGALLVTDASGALVGILSERDIVRKLADTPGQTLPQKVSENMTAKVVTCSPTDSLVEVLKRMSAGRFRHMPVVESGAICGMVTIGDVVHFRLAEVEHEALQLKQMIVG
ncbi:MAG: CBS domain-containing protein [Pseudomonadota bacterium]